MYIYAVCNITTDLEGEREWPSGGGEGVTLFKLLLFRIGGERDRDSDLE